MTRASLVIRKTAIQRIGYHNHNLRKYLEKDEEDSNPCIISAKSRRRKADNVKSEAKRVKERSVVGSFEAFTDFWSEIAQNDDRVMASLIMESDSSIYAMIFALGSQINDVVALDCFEKGITNCFESHYYRSQLMRWAGVSVTQCNVNLVEWLLSQKSSEKFHCLDISRYMFEFLTCQEVPGKVRPIIQAAMNGNWEAIDRVVGYFFMIDLDEVDMEGLSLRPLVENAPASTKDLLLRVHKWSAFANQEKEYIVHPDLSGGRERFPVRVINTVDREVISASIKYCVRVFDPEGLLANRKPAQTAWCECKSRCSGMGCTCPTISYVDNRLDEDKLKECIVECSEQCMCSLHCGNRVAQQGPKSPVEIFRTAVRGWGVRALRPIFPGTYIGEYTGLLRRDGDGRGEYLFETRAGDVSITIDALDHGNFTRYINHSCRSNAHCSSVIWDSTTSPYYHICLYAKRTINCFEEITIDYGREWWEEKVLSFACSCGEPDCEYSGKKREAIIREAKKKASIVPSSCGL